MSINYTPRQPIEIILNSKTGTKIGELDGHKFYELEREISARKNEIMLLHLKKAFIPFSFYTLSASQKNNKIDVKETQSDNTTNTYTITIPSGNYNILELISKLTELMNEASTFSFTYNISYNENTSKVSFLITSGTNIGSTTLLFATGNSAATSIKTILGFTETDVSFTDTTSVESQNIVDMADGLDSLHIKSNLTGDNIQSTNDSGELLIIPVFCEPNGIIYFDEGGNAFKHKLSQSSIKRIEIKITDSNGNVVDFNQIPQTLILLVDFVFNEEQIVSTSNSAERERQSQIQLFQEEQARRAISGENIFT